MSEEKAEVTQELCLAPLPETERGYRRMIYAAATRKDGDWMVYTYDRHVVMRRLDDPRISKMFSGHKHKATVAKMSPSGYWIASGDVTGQVHVWGPSNQNIKNTVNVTGSVMDIDWDAESKRVCAVGKGNDCLGKVFPFDSSNAIGECSNHSKAIITCSMKPTRPYRVATGGEDLNVNFYNFPPVKFDHSTKLHSRYPNQVQFSPDGNSLLSAGADGKIVIYDGKTGEMTKEIEDKENGHKGAVYACVWSPDNKSLLTASADKTAKIWDVESGKVVTTLTVSDKPSTNDQQVSALWFKDYVITVSLSGAINYWDPASPDAPKQVIHGHASKILSLGVSGETIYTGDQLGQLCVWNDGVATWFSGKGHEKAITGVAVSKDGDTVYTIGMDDKMRANEAKSQEFSSDAVALGGSPKGVATGNKDNALAVVVLAQGKIVVARGGKVVSSHDIGYKPNAVSLNPDDTEIMVGGADKKVHFYSLDGDTVKETRVDDEHEHQINGVRYSSNGAAASASADRAVRVVDPAGKLLNKSTWEFHDSGVNAVAFNPSSSRAVTVANDLTVFVWKDTDKWSTKRAQVKMAQMDSIDKVEWLNDDRFATVGGDGSLKVWSL